MGYNEMKKDVLKDKTPTQNPNINYVIGQTGSGKTTLISNLIKTKGNNYVIIDNDLWRGYYPNYSDIVQIHKTDEIPEITQTMKKWRGQLLKESSDKHYNMIMHTSLTNTTEFLDQATSLQENGYTCSMSIVACNEYYSRIRCCTRYIISVIRQRLW